MKIKIESVEVKTSAQVDFIDVTDQVKKVVLDNNFKDGLLTVFSPHTTASITINHNEPMLIKDMTRTLYRVAPVDERYDHDLFELSKKHQSDGRSNGSSHCKEIFLGSSVSVPVSNGELKLGARQSIFFVELDGGRSRDFLVQIIGE